MGHSGRQQETHGQQPSDSESLPLDLVGSHQGALDAKRRVAIPKAFRTQLEAEPEGEFVLCRQLGGDPCLALFPPGRFELALQKLEQLKTHSAGVGHKTIRAYMRKLRMSAARLKPDKQKRITLSEDQCRLAGIEKEVAFVGSGDHMELWAPGRLEQDDDLDFGALANEIFG